MKVFHHAAYDVQIESEIELDGLRLADPFVTAPVVRVVRAMIHERAPDGAPLFFQHNGTEQFLAWSMVGRFRVRNDRTIEVCPNIGVPDALIALPLLGTVMATLLHRRGLMVLHASAVEVNGVAVALLGDKGAGKSTTAAALVAAGHALISDDIVAIDSRGYVLPAGGGLKLWPDSGRQLSGAGFADLGRLHDGIDKGRYALPSPAAQRPVPVERFYLLNRAPEAGVAALSTVASLNELLRHAYMARFGDMGFGARLPDYFTRAGTLVRSGRVRALTTPLGLERLDEIAPLVEADLADSSQLRLDHEIAPTAATFRTAAE